MGGHSVSFPSSPPNFTFRCTFEDKDEDDIKSHSSSLHSAQASVQCESLIYIWPDFPFARLEDLFDPSFEEEIVSSAYQPESSVSVEASSSISRDE